MSKPKKIPKKRFNEEAAQHVLKVSQIYTPKNKRAYLIKQAQFLLEINELSNKIDKVIDKFVKATDFTIEGDDRVKGMIRHLINVHMLYVFPDDELKAVFVGGNTKAFEGENGS